VAKGNWKRSIFLGFTHFGSQTKSGRFVVERMNLGKRVRFYSTVDLVNLLEREKHDDKAGRADRPSTA
jgi:hypothetical protein